MNLKGQKQLVLNLQNIPVLAFLKSSTGFLTNLLMNRYINTFIKISLITLFFLNMCCKNKEPKPEPLINIDVDIKKKSTEIDFSEYFSSSDLVLLESNKESIFSEIDRIWLFENKIFILDRKLNGVFIFNKQGNFLNKIRNIGRGPQEYNSLMDFAVDEKHRRLLLYTDRPYKIFIFDFEGNFIKKLNLNNLYYNIGVMNDDLLLLNKNPERDFFVFHYDLISENLEKEFLEITDKDRVYRRFGINRPYMTKDKNIHISFPYSNIIYEYDKNVFAPKYNINFGEQEAPNNLHENFKDYTSLFETVKENNYGLGISHFRENKNYITFNYQLDKLVIYSKKNKKSKTISIINNEYKIYGSYYAHDGNDNNFISIYSALSLKTQMEIYKKNKLLWETVPENVKEINRQVSENDNPLLMIYKFKE